MLPHILSFCVAAVNVVLTPCPKEALIACENTAISWPAQSIGHFNVSSFQIRMKVAGLNTVALRVI